MYIYICIYTYVYTYTYIYIYIRTYVQRERERERDTYVHTHIYMNNFLIPNSFFPLLLVKKTRIDSVFFFCLYFSRGLARLDRIIGFFVKLPLAR